METRNLVYDVIHGMDNYKSKCCGAKVKAEGMPDFPGSTEVCTISFSCLQCGKGCDIKPRRRKRKVRGTEKSQTTPTSGKTSAAKKQKVQKKQKQLDFIKKLVGLLDGITIDPIKGVILTPKKKRQLAELQKSSK